jgi:hypothetical protein
MAPYIGALLLFTAAQAAPSENQPKQYPWERDWSKTWVETVADVEGSIWYIRGQDFARGAGTHEVWIRQNHLKNRHVRARESMWLYRIDCSRRYAQLLSHADYDKDRRPLESRYGVSASEPIVPESALEMTADQICAQRRPPQ